MYKQVVSLGNLGVTTQDILTEENVDTNTDL